MDRLNETDIRSWSAETMLLETWHELNQKSALATSYMKVLLNENAYGFVSEEQKLALTRLQQELEIIRELSKLLEFWISVNKTQ